MTATTTRTARTDTMHLTARQSADTLYDTAQAWKVAADALSGGTLRRALIDLHRVDPDEAQAAVRDMLGRIHQIAQGLTAVSQAFDALTGDIDAIHCLVNEVRHRAGQSPVNGLQTGA